jgi:uncharacterized Zn finger protein (UPF0148 family)
MEGGVVPKKPTQTPTKKTRNIENVFKKTAACGRVEKALDVTVESLMHGTIICKNCDREATKISKNEADSKKLNDESTRLCRTLRDKYESALIALKDKYGITTSKRLSHTNSPEKSTKRQLISSDHDKENKENTFRIRQPKFVQDDKEEQPSKVWVSTTNSIIRELHMNNHLQ